jgi:hypothetical protein
MESSKQILDANYTKADLQAVVTNCTQLNSVEQNKLLELLRKFEPLFDETLGNWRTMPVSFQLKEGVTPYHVPWQSFSDTQSTQRSHHERNSETL